MTSYTIHGNTVFIEADNRIGQYIVHGETVSKMVQTPDGDEELIEFHIIGDLPLNTEAEILNSLRDNNRI